MRGQHVCDGSAKTVSQPRPNNTSGERATEGAISPVLGIHVDRELLIKDGRDLPFTLGRLARQGFLDNPLKLDTSVTAPHRNMSR